MAAEDMVCLGVDAEFDDVGEVLGASGRFRDDAVVRLFLVRRNLGKGAVVARVVVDCEALRSIASADDAWGKTKR